MAKLSDYAEFVSPSAELKDIEKKKRKVKKWTEICFWVVLYCITVAVQSIYSGQPILNGIVAQLQTIISTILVIRYPRRGYLTAMLFNSASSIFALTVLLVTRETTTIVGVIVSLSSMVIITFLSISGRKLNSSMRELKRQREELVALAEETEEAYDEVKLINEQLLESNLIIKENEERLSHMAFFDALTELPNRRMIINRLDFHISFSTKTNKVFTLVFVDLDNFKIINDTLGHNEGDAIIKAVAKRIKAHTSADDMLGRLGGDEFALLIQRDLSEIDATSYIESIRQSLLEPFEIDSNEVNVFASFGATTFPKDGLSSAELLKCADMALYKAKSGGKNKVQFFRVEMREEVQNRIDFEASLVAALQNEEFLLVFQPQYAPDSNKLRGFETLVRWQSSDLGTVSPVQFIPMAEETGLIIELGRWIFTEACRKLRSAIDKYNLDDIVLSVNISAVQLMEPGFLDMIKNIMDKTGVYGRNLEFEITESVFISSMESVVSILNELKSLGILIALDDFGTGYSSLNYLRSLPIDTLKIDKSFIDGINRQEAEKEIVGSIISLAHNMNMYVVAEGVELENQLAYLRENGCDCIQGFLLGKPLNEEDFNTLLKKASEQRELEYK